MNNNKKQFMLLVLTLACLAGGTNSIQSMERYGEIEVAGRGMWDQQFPLISKICGLLTRIQMTEGDARIGNPADHIQITFAQLNELKPPRSYSREGVYDFSIVCAKKNLKLISALEESYRIYVQPDPCLAKIIMTEAEQGLSHVHSLLGQLKSLADEEISLVPFCSACDKYCKQNNYLTFPCCNKLMCLNCDEKLTVEGYHLCLNCEIEISENDYQKMVRDSQK